MGHPTGHFNVGQYRRKIKEGAELQDAEFFDHNNPVGAAAIVAQAAGHPAASNATAEAAATLTTTNSGINL